MINPIELRIGNLVNFIPDGVDFSINEINYFKEPFTINGLDPENINPIFITEEWLIKLGFEKGVSDYYGIGIVYTHKETEITIYDRTNETFSLYRYNDYKVIFSYIHQLQNLIYSLTGEELKLNE